MAISLEEGRYLRDNLAMEDDLTHKMNGIDSQVQGWMASAETLISNAKDADEAQVVALRKAFIDKITKAIST